MISTTEYLEKKASGLLKMTKLVDYYAVSTARFSPDDGSKLDSDISNFRYAELTAARESLVKQLADLDLLIADCATLGK